MFGKDRRFKVKHKESLSGGNIYIVVDTETDVNYIMSVGMSPSMTPLLDENGNVVIDKKG